MQRLDGLRRLLPRWAAGPAAALIALAILAGPPLGQPALSTVPVAEASSVADSQAPASASPRVAIQAGHWKPWDQPSELSVLRNAIGAFGGNWSESVVNLSVAEKVVAILKREGLQVDLLPATIPVDYKADAFVALHGDANGDPDLSGFKAAHSIWSRNSRDDALVGDLVKDYGAATGLKEERSTITANMTMYYAFNTRFQHSLDPSTPAAILEMGFLTNDGDRKIMEQQQDRVAAGIAKGILDFLNRPSRTGL